MRDRFLRVRELGEKKRFVLQFFPWWLDVYLDNFGCSRASFVSLGQIVGEFLVRCLSQSLLLPQVRRQICVSLGDRGISGLGKVSERAG